MVRPITQACKREHIWTNASTYYDKNGKRGCRICRADAERSRYSKLPVSQRHKRVADPTKPPRPQHTYANNEPPPALEQDPVATYWPMFQLYPDQLRASKPRVWKHMELAVAQRMGHTPSVLLVHETLVPAEGEWALLGDSLVIRTADRTRKEPVVSDRSVFYGR